jgi:hypothetical protein
VRVEVADHPAAAVQVEQCRQALRVAAARRAVEPQRDRPVRARRLQLAHQRHRRRIRLREETPLAVGRAGFHRAQHVHRRDALGLHQVEQGAGVGVQHGGPRQKL